MRSNGASFTTRSRTIPGLKLIVSRSKEPIRRLSFSVQSTDGDPPSARHGDWSFHSASREFHGRAPPSPVRRTRVRLRLPESTGKREKNSCPDEEFLQMRDAARH